MKYSVTEYNLERGGKGLIVNVPDAPVVSMEWQFRAGNRYADDYDNKAQTPHIMEHMMASATKSHPSVIERSAIFSENGAYSNASTSPTNMRYIAYCADFEWDRILELMRDEICQPYFEQGYFKKEVENVQSELSGYLSNAGRMMWPTIARAMGSANKTFPQMIETLDNINLGDVIAHYQKTHTMGNMRFVLAGDFTREMDRLQKLLNSFNLPEGRRLPYIGDKFHSAPAQLIERHDVPAISLFFETCIPCEMNDDGLWNMYALNHILTGTMSSRIYGKARSQGLMYHCDSTCTYDRCSTSWRFNGRANADKLPVVFDLLANEIKRVADGDISDDEIAKSQSYLLGRHKMDIQTTRQLANYLAGRYFYNDEVKDYNSTPDKIKRINKDDMVRLAREFLAANTWTVGLYGSTDQNMANLMQEKLGTLFG